MKRKFEIELDVSEEVDEETLRQYIFDAVGSWGGQFHPEHPLFPANWKGSPMVVRPVDGGEESPKQIVVPLADSYMVVSSESIRRYMKENDCPMQEAKRIVTLNYLQAQLGRTETLAGVKHIVGILLRNSSLENK